jgi:hypothetical protein
MTTQQKLGLGAPLAAVAALAAILLPALGLTDVGRPWGFLLGFLVGVGAGLGGTLAIVGLLERRAGSS